MSLPPAVGVVTGLTVEAEILRPLADRGLIRLGIAGASSRRAGQLARRFADEGVRALVSFGVCGGLAPELRVGELVLAEHVVHPEGPTVATHAPWRAALAQALTGVTVKSGALLGSAILVAQPAEKAALHRQHRALAVDMESHAVAAVAAELGLPFLAVRACSEPAGRAFPFAALESVGPDGSVRVGPALRALARRPWILPALFRLGLETRHALATLKRVAAAGPALLEPQQQA